MSPGLAVAWWIIPYANYVMPFVAMRALRRGAGEASHHESVRSGESIVWIWWVLYQAGAFLGLIGTAWLFPRFFTSTGGSSREAAEQMIWFSRVVITILGSTLVAQGLSAIPAIAIVGQIQERLDAIPPPSVPPRPDVF